MPKYSKDPNTKNADIEVINGMVEPGTGGMSASPSIAGLPLHRKPEEHGGTGKDPVFRLNITKLGPKLMYMPDTLTHGIIQPTEGTTYEEYKKALEKTQKSWEKTK